MPGFTRLCMRPCGRLVRPHSGHRCANRCARLASLKASDRDAPQPGSSSQEARPEADDAATPSTSSSNSSTAGGGGDSSSPSVSGRADQDVDALVTATMESTFLRMKAAMMADLPPDQAAMVESWTLEEMMDSNRLMARMADEYIQPLLGMLGVEEEPLPFFWSLVKLATGLQLISAASIFYTTQLTLGMDAGDSLRCVGGFGLGLLLRIFVPVEQLLSPVYAAFLQAVTGDRVESYQMAKVPPGAVNKTLNKLAVTVAVSFLVPKLLWGYSNQECLQLVVPLAGGLFLFDLTYLAAVMLKLRML